MRILSILFLAVLFSCCDGPEPRKPVQTKSGSFFKASIERSRKLLEAEEKKIQAIIELVDKQELFLGLRDAVKMLKEKERATFLFPSSIAFGYHGDENKIGSNVPLKSTITILQIEKQQENTVN